MEVSWPELTAENRPWTRWWWHGCAVDSATIGALLELYAAAGIGGVEITSIYGVLGNEDREIDFLSPRWIDAVRETIGAAQRLGMLVDLPTGSGWRFGGPFITPEEGSARIDVQPNGAVAFVPTNELVKRAGPGGRGLAFNPFLRASVNAVLDHYRGPLGALAIRAQFHDSWEYDSSGSPDVLAAFLERRGYDLRDRVELWDTADDPDRRARLRYDYKLTLAELSLEAFIERWTAWCHELGHRSRNQAHGSPGNWLDLYAASDIPETEVFREPTPDMPLLAKIASSAAHVAGRRIASSETGTWLREHFTVTLADLKLLVDELFVAGINHHVFHGTAYSPPGAAWPGWLFYASTQLNPQNPIWRDLRALTDYMTRCQAVLQAGEPDVDLAVYLPFHDVLHEPDYEPGEWLPISGEWFSRLAAAPVIRDLWRRGCAFDYVSDRQICEAACVDGEIVLPGGRYRALVVPPVRFLPPQTALAFSRLAAGGATVARVRGDELVAPDAPGLADLAPHRDALESAVGSLAPPRPLTEALASIMNVRARETEAPLREISRRVVGGRFCFLRNESARAIDEWIRLGEDGDATLIMDPLTGRTGAAQREGDRVRVQLGPYATLVVRTLDRAANAEPWPYETPAGPPVTLGGPWSVEFIAGGPFLPGPFETSELGSWTVHGEDAERFGGTARYSLRFSAPGDAPAWRLDLGRVCESARVRLNGVSVGTLIGPVFCTTVGRLEPGSNLLEIEVTNLAANRIRDLDRRGVAWRIFDEINFVSREYGAFDASAWPIRESGLLGPVTLVPLAVGAPAR